MKKIIQLQVKPATAFNEALLKQEVAKDLNLNSTDTFYIKPVRRSIDARNRHIKINLSVLVSVNEPLEETPFTPLYKHVENTSKTCHIIGAGPAGLFAALRCLELGIQPIIIERGKDVKARRRDLAALNKEHIVNPESNYCFGEGGAGTYSDGKLYTRSTKRGDVEKILKTFVYHGADETILVDAHPHIGTNKLPQLIENIRETILKQGGKIYFESKLVDFTSVKSDITSLVVQHTTERKEHLVQQVILATGHSARDIYELLNQKNILLEAKPFALGVRVEHPQTLIDKIQYHCGNLQEVINTREYLPAASYNLVQQVNGYGVYSFCMCPGGIIAPCATAPGEVVTNGWSPSKRNNPYANSGIVVGLTEKDFAPFQKQYGALAALALQQQFEVKAWNAGGQTQTAPAQALQDFVTNTFSQTLPNCSYYPGVKSVNMLSVLGNTIGKSLQAGFTAFGKKMQGYISNDALIVGVESRTSTPVRIPRDKETLCHPQLNNLFPCGEGAGYAGGIMSAAMDGERCVDAINFAKKI
jgi:uncharacterized protein